MNKDFGQLATEESINKVKDALTDERSVEEYYFHNHQQFATARLSTIVVRDLDLAKELALQVAEEEGDFHALARKYSVDSATKYAGGYMGEVARYSLPLDLAVKVFSASAGDLVGPFEQGEQYLLILVEELFKGELNEIVKRAIKDILFDQWLDNVVGEGFVVNR